MDSPAFRFTGPEKVAENAMVGGNDTRGISLRPEYTVYPTDAEKASFILYNNSGDKVYYGRDYTITYEDTDGVWRGLPTDRIVVLIACPVKRKAGESITFSRNSFRFSGVLSIKRISMSLIPTPVLTTFCITGVSFNASHRSLSLF